MSENSSSQPAPGEETAHRDGLRLVHGKGVGGQLTLQVELWVSGRPDHAAFAPVDVFLHPDDSAGRADQDRHAILLKAVCDFCNTGGDVNNLAGLIEQVRRFPVLRSPYPLVSVLPPGGGNTVVWARPDGTFLRAVDGEEGFVEVLTAAEVEETEVARLTEDEPEGML